MTRTRRQGDKERQKVCKLSYQGETVGSLHPAAVRQGDKDKETRRQDDKEKETR